MKTAGLPPHYNDLALSFERAWAILADGVQNRKGAGHVPVVASVDAAGRPRQRVMILRQADCAQRRLRFHTDVRSTKTAELEDGAQVAVLVYSVDEKVQLRIGGTAHIDPDSATADLAWQQSTTFARRCYMAEDAPGTSTEAPTSGLPSSIEGKQPTEDDLAEFRRNFAVIWVDVVGIEYLYLANSGHRRARWQWHEMRQNWSGSWLVP